MSKKIPYLKDWLPYAKKRHIMYMIATIISLSVPWIVINGNHLFLLSFEKLKLHLLFVQFDMQQLYLMPFLLMILFLGIFGMTVLGGRVFCGWFCPQTIFRVVYRDFIETKLLGMRRSVKNKQKDIDYSKNGNKVKKVIAILIWTFLAFLAASDLMWFFVPPEDFMVYIMNPSEHTVLFGTIFVTVAFLVYDIIFLQENFCVYVCPYSRVQSVLYDDDTIMAIYNPHRGGEIYNDNKEKVHNKTKTLLEVEPQAECTTCESCVTVCPTHIDIRQGLQLECINCLECVDACTVVMGKLNKPSLVMWSSEKETLYQKGKTHYLRPKIIGYGVILLLLMVILLKMGGDKERMLLNVNKESRLYSISNKNNKHHVENAYIFLLQNTENEKHKFYFDLIVPKEYEGKIKIKKPTEPFSATPNVRKKKIVVLYADDVLVKSDRKDTIIPVTIKAYAIDNKKEIVVTRKTTFTYPKYDVLMKHK